MICIVCKKEFPNRYWNGDLVNYCSRTCYYNLYYKNNKEKIDSRRKEWYIKNYAYKPKNPKYNSEEEKIKAQKVYRKKYIEEHLEYYKQKNKIWYQEHKYNITRKQSEKRAMHKYLKRKRGL